MTKGLKEGEPNGREIYPDIIDHPHWQSPTRLHMSLYDRAAQFSPFDALTGYSDMISEEQRLTDKKIELSEEEIARLNQKFRLIYEIIKDGGQPTVSVTYFEPDPLKDGGSYETVSGQIIKINVISRKLIMVCPDGNDSHREIFIPDILEIHGDGIDCLDAMIE